MADTAPGGAGARPAPKPFLDDLVPYRGGQGETRAGGNVFKLSSNESALGPSPKAVEAYHEAAGRLAAYPDGEYTGLREALAARHGLNPDWIVLGNGSDEILSLLAQIYAGPGDEVVASIRSFAMYLIAAKAQGATFREAPDRDFRADVDALLAACGPATRLVYLANPNNPTGTCIGDAELRRLHAGLRSDTLLVIDGAYAEYVEAADYEAGIELVSEAENVVMTRTFSKAYGLAGLRVGWAYAPPAVVDYFKRVRGPFNVSIAAQAAALAALEDRAHLEKVIAHNTRWRGWLQGELSALDLDVVPSAANFLLVQLATPAAAQALERALAARGLFVRRFSGGGLERALRITIGPAAANRALVAAVKDVLSGTETGA